MNKRIANIVGATTLFSLVVSAEAAKADLIYWRHDTNFEFSTDGKKITKCYYQYVSQEVECPKNTWVTEEPRCSNMVWLHNANINNKKKLLFTFNFGKEKPSHACNALLKTLGKPH